jgi:Xaa-Pro dipeptidase
MSEHNQDPEEKKSIVYSRHARLAVALLNSGLDALVLNPGPTLTYLTGLEFHLSERPVVAIFRPHSQPILILPELEGAKLANLPLPVQAFPYGENPAGWANVFKQGVLAARLNPAKVGVEPTRLRYLELRLLEDAAHDAGFVSAEGVIAEMRMIKDDQEIQAMRKAVQIAQDALLATLPAIRPGKTEQEIAAELSMQLLKHGSSSEMPFVPIIASGPNSANPHAAPTNRAIQEGDLLIIDWGARYDGYVSDLTRTFAIGQVDPELTHIASIVSEANAAARMAARPGIAAGQVDYAARQVIQAAGYGEYFIHRTGHGLGLEGHEPPYMFAENELELEPGQTFTIEPGIYLPGRGGVRIEDDVVVTQEGSESLSDLPRELIRID